MFNMDFQKASVDSIEKMSQNCLSGEEIQSIRQCVLDEEKRDNASGDSDLIVKHIDADNNDSLSEQSLSDEEDNDNFNKEKDLLTLIW
ncbi:hypothetical protein Trydic_g14862 [Trypoxylus dichotomus]